MPPKHVVDAFLLAILGNYVTIQTDYPNDGYIFECGDTLCVGCPFKLHCIDGTYNPIIAEYTVMHHPEVLL